VVQGELLQLHTVGTLADEATYLRMIDAKTAALFSAACALGGMLADVSAETLAQLETFGRELGRAFQIADDLLDYQGDPTAIGKMPANDFWEGKATLPVLYAYAAGTPDEQAFWIRCFVDGVRDDAALATACQLLAHHDAYAAAAAKAYAHAVAAREALHAVADACPLREALDAVITFAVSRTH
jgi:octaprenyl-diphosphate synthase